MSGAGPPHRQAWKLKISGLVAESHLFSLHLFFPSSRTIFDIHTATADTFAFRTRMIYIPLNIDTEVYMGLLAFSV